MLDVGGDASARASARSASGEGGASSADAGADGDTRLAVDKVDALVKAALDALSVQ